MRELDPGREPVPDATALLRFRHLLQMNMLGQTMLFAVNAEPKLRGCKMQPGTHHGCCVVFLVCVWANAYLTHRDEWRRHFDSMHHRQGHVVQRSCHHSFSIRYRCRLILTHAASKHVQFSSRNDIE